MNKDSNRRPPAGTSHQHTANWARLCLAILISFGPAAKVSGAVLTGSTGSHDPSRMIFCNGKYYIYSTGGGMKSSSDRIAWTSGTSPFTGFSGSRPPSMKAVIASDQGIWAPDIIFYNNKYYLYYSCAASDGLHCAIGLVTSPTLDPAAAGYKWTDVGVVISTNDKVEKKSGIDPAPFVDASGNLWLAWGSGYANGATWSDPTIILSRLDNTTGLRSAADLTYYPTALGHIEGSYLHYRNGFYYLFWNSGGCCDGATSSYTVHLARSANVTGPYVDKNGSASSAVTFMSSTVNNVVLGKEHGPGHIGILSEPGIDRFTFHYYPDTGGSVIGQETIVWGADGWPTAGVEFAPGTYKITSVATGLALGVRGAAATDGVPIESQTYTASAYQKWTVAFTFSSGTTKDGFYSIVSAGSGKAFDLYQSGTADGTLIDQWTAGTGNNQRWLIEQTTDGRYRIESRSSRDVIAEPARSQTPIPQFTPQAGGPDGQLTFPSQVGWSYRVMGSTDLQGWALLSTQAGTGNPITVPQANVIGGGKRFWRLEIQQAANAWTWGNLNNQKWNFSAP